MTKIIHRGNCILTEWQNARRIEETSDRLLASVLKIYQSNKIYKFISTGTVSISTRRKH